MPLPRPPLRETTALGAAYLAGLATGVWRDLDELRALRTLEQRYTPNMEENTRTDLLRGWHKAVGRSLHWAQDEN